MVKSKIVVIGNAALVSGFQLAGLEDAVLTEKSDFQKILEDYLTKTEFGIIIINQSALNDIDWRLKKKLDTIAYPVIVPIPDVASTESGGEEIRMLIKRALGFDLAAQK